MNNKNATLMMKAALENDAPATGAITSREATVLKQQIMREIACLERQLERVRSREEFAEYNTLQTYQEMIESRRKMLDNLPW